MRSIYSGVIAEFVGTFALMFVGGGAIILSNGENLVAIALAHGLILSCMVTATMHISGGQINPAVSLALSMIGRQSGPRTAAFIVAQLAGAVAAAGVLKVGLMSGWSTQIETTSLGATLGAFSAAGEAQSAMLTLLFEFIATFFLMFVIIGSAVDPRGVGKGPMVGGFAIGLTVAANILFFGPLTGASMNPARSFGPALAGGVWEMQYMYWIAPILGAAAAAAAWQWGIGIEEDLKQD
ncbi:MAG: MIP/aquaporin family protein [Phycisphaerales bacterium]